MQSKSEIQIKVSDIARKLERGLTTTAIVKEYTGKYGLNRRTIERYIALAKDIISSNMKARDKVIEAVRADIITKEAEKWLKSNLELEAKLCAIVSGKIQFMRPVQTKDGVDVIKSYPSCREIISAVNILMKMRGVYKFSMPGDENNKPIIQVVVQTEEEKLLLESINESEHKRK